MLLVMYRSYLAAVNLTLRHKAALFGVGMGSLALCAPEPSHHSSLCPLHPLRNLLGMPGGLEEPGVKTMALSHL